MKNKTIFFTIALSALVLLAATAVVFAQQLNAPAAGNDETISDEVTASSPLEANTNTTYHQPSGNWEGQVSETSNGQVVNPMDAQPTVIFEPASGASGEASPTTLHIPTNAVVPAPVQLAINSLEVNPAQVFSSDFSQVTNLVVNPTVEDKKVIYQLEVPINTQIYKSNELMPQPLLDLKFNQPVEFRLSDNKVIINNEQIVDYKNIVGGNEPVPLVELKINSAITDGQVHNLEVVAGPESTKFKFIYKDKEVMMPTYSDFKVENQKISLLHDGQAYDLKVLPPEIYAKIYSALESGESGKDIEVKDLSIKVLGQKAVYDLNVKEPFKLFLVIPMKINSQYIFDSASGFVIDKNKPWWTVFGKKTSWLVGETAGGWKVELYTEEMK